MSATWQIEVTHEFVFVRVRGPYNGIDETSAGMSMIVEQCRVARCWRVLLDITLLNEPIPQMDRFLLGKRVGRMWGQRMKVAILARPEHITRFFENVANNNGANVQVFADYDAAQAWLKVGRLAG